MNELDEILEVVDENNNVISKATRGECYQKGLLHRAVNIFIYNSKGEVFLHKRAEKKLKYPGFWDLSCSEHVRPGESFEQTAKRGLKEELGIEISLKEIIPLHRVDNNAGEYKDNELVITFKGIYEGEMKYDPNEVAEGKFFNIQEIPSPVTSWFLEDWKLINQKR